MKILDCTLRDGGYINNWRFNKDFTENLSKLLSKSDVDLVEIGFINKTNNYRNKIVGYCRILSKNDIESFISEKGGKVNNITYTKNLLYVFNPFNLINWSLNSFKDVF